MALPGLACLKAPREEHGFRAAPLVSGAAPADLKGRLYRVGPGRFADGEADLGHWFDGEGLAVAVDFDGRAARCAVRMIAEPPAPAEDKGRFGVAPRSMWRRLKSMWRADAYANPANTALVFWGERLLALFEGGHPTELDPDTLAPIGVTDLGVVRRSFGAHPKLHRPTGDLINQGFRFSPRPVLDYYRLSPDGHATLFNTAPYNGATFTHDFAVTDRCIVSVSPPVFGNPFDVVVRGQSLKEALAWREKRPTEFLVTPIDGGRTRRLTTPAVLYSHTAFAYDDGDDVVVAAIASAGASNMEWINAVSPTADALPPAEPSRLTEFRLSTTPGNVTRRTLSDARIDFPKINEAWFSRRLRRARYVYAAGYKDDARAYEDMFDAMVKLDLSGAPASAVRVDFGPGVYVSEPMFAPRPDAQTEDDGWLLVKLYDSQADESFVAVLDASGTPREVARFSLGQALPLSFHGLWRPA
ncbi:MAG: carotenoid oxygenase family protein [Pseudomonadota bacterium]